MLFRSNLLKLPWVKDLVRINKSFIVERGLPMRQMLMASKRLSSNEHKADDYFYAPDGD